MFETTYHIGYSLNQDIRYKSSSGGIGSEIIKYLLSTEEYGTSMTFFFNREKCMYEPKLIYSFDDYNNCGSIYQDTDTIGFIKHNILNIRKGIVVTCMPCQVKAIRNLLGGQCIKNFIISLCCSGQTTVEGTWYYYKMLGVDRTKVVNMQYRGNGWPSGIQISLNDGQIIKKDNWTYPWTMMHQSLLFRPKRCLSCTFKTVTNSDINLADPWLDEYMSDSIGNSVIITNTKEGIDVINELRDENNIAINEVDEATFIRSQKGTIEAKKHTKDHILFIKLIKWMSSSWYKRVVLSKTYMLKTHNKLILKLYKFL